MFSIIFMGMCLAIGFYIGKKIINNFEYHSYIQGEKLKAKYGPTVKEKTSHVSGAIKGAAKYHLEQMRKGKERWRERHCKGV